MLKRIFNDSLQNLKKNGLMSFMLSLIAILSTAIIMSLMFIPMFGEFLILFIIAPLLLVPLLFAIQTMHFGLREGTQPGGKTFFRFFKAYFSPGIMGVYRVINTILFAMLAEIFTSLIVGGILIAFVNTNPDFMNALTDLTNALTANDPDWIAQAIQNEHIRILAFSSYVPGFGMAVMVAFLSSSFNSMSIYFKIKNPLINPAYSNRMYVFSKNKIRGTLIKEYWALNWPIYVLFGLGFALGVSIAYFMPEFTYIFGMAIGLAMGLAFALVYLPFFVSNLESIYLAHHADNFASAPNEFAHKMQDVLNAQMASMQQQMQDLAKQQEEVKNDQDKNDQNNDSNNNVNDANENKVDTANNNDIIDAEVKDDNNLDK